MHSAEVHLVSRYSNVFLNFHITNVIIIIEKKKTNILNILKWKRHNFINDYISNLEFSFHRKVNLW